MRNTRILGYLTLLGLIMVSIPVNSAVIMLLYSLFRHTETVVETSVEGPSVVYLSGNFPDYLPLTGIIMFAAGCIILGCIIVIQHRRNKHGRSSSA